MVCNAIMIDVEVTLGNTGKKRMKRYDSYTGSPTGIGNFDTLFDIWIVSFMRDDPHTLSFCESNQLSICFVALCKLIFRRIGILCFSY